MKNLKKIISVTAAAAMVMSTVAPVSVFADDATFKIGGIGPVTGAAAIYGQAVKNATELAINEVNEDGGINGYQVEFKFEDDENDAEKTLNAYNALKDWGMHILLGAILPNGCIRHGNRVLDRIGEQFDIHRRSRHELGIRIGDLQAAPHNR